MRKKRKSRIENPDIQCGRITNPTELRRRQIDRAKTRNLNKNLNDYEEFPLETGHRDHHHHPDGHRHYDWNDVVHAWGLLTLWALNVSFL